MALRDQPYLPLYIQDFLTDEKLVECSAQATGVYVRLMCMMHKSEIYGKILLKQKDKQTGNQIKNFAIKIAKQMPYDLVIVELAINELLGEGVLFIDEDCLCQKRMIKDNKLSLTRAKAGKKGGKFAQAKVKAKTQANTENEYENEIVIENVNTNAIKDSKLEIFESMFGDERFVEELTLAHKGKNLRQAWEQCWIHHSQTPSPPREVWQWKQKFNTWLSNTKINGHSKNGKESPADLAAAFAERVRQDALNRKL